MVPVFRNRYFYIFYLFLFIGEISLIFTSNDFISPPTTVKTKENGTVLLPCYLNTISNDDVYAKAVRWYKNNTLLADSSDETLSISSRHFLWENGSIEIRNVEPQDTAEYVCEIIRPDPWGSVKQKHAIEVLHPPSVQIFPSSGFIQVKLGDKVNMSCKGDGVPYPIITWSSKGEELNPLNYREQLIFTADDKKLAGIYECTAMNGVGEPASRSIELSIIYPPEVQAIKPWIHSAPTYRALLKCLVTAKPQATVTWLKGDVLIPLDNRIVSMIDGDKHTLLIRNVQRSDFGIYTCRAGNTLGQGEVKIQLSGVPNPGIFKNVELNSSSNTSTFIWEVDSYTPIIEYSLWFRPYKSRRGLNTPNWSKLTIPTESSTGTVYSKRYTLKGLSEKTVYEILMVSRNRFGWSKPSSIVRFATKGAEIGKDMITTVQISAEDTSVVQQSEFKSSTTSSGTLRIFNLMNFFFLVFLWLFIKTEM